MPVVRIVLHDVRVDTGEVQLLTWSGDDSLSNKLSITVVWFDMLILIFCQVYIVLAADRVVRWRLCLGH